MTLKPAAARVRTLGDEERGQRLQRVVADERAELVHKADVEVADERRHDLRRRRLRVGGHEAAGVEVVDELRRRGGRGAEDAVRVDVDDLQGSAGADGRGAWDERVVARLEGGPEEESSCEVLVRDALQVAEICMQRSHTFPPVSPTAHRCRSSAISSRSCLMQARCRSQGFGERGLQTQIR